MTELDALELAPDVAASLPDWSDVLAHLASPRLPRVVDVLRAAEARGRPAVQPRCGVGGHTPMRELLRELEGAGPDILSVTIDSHTRLRKFGAARDVLLRDPAELNGYPLVTHGWRRGRQLVGTVGVPLEVRHGSPDPRELFAVSLASGITSFEGGGIGYNLPYSKDVPLARSLRAWQRVDAVCGALARSGVVVDRELFGTLTAVLVPPSVSLAMTLLEGVAAVAEGVRCLSIAYPQSGEAHQDIAALRATRTLARRYLGPDVEVYPVLHEFMGVFPSTHEFAGGLILLGGLTARLGGATKVITKTVQEARGIPDAAANASGLRTAIFGASDLLDFVRVDEDRVAEEQHWIEREVAELVEPVLAADVLFEGIERAFRDGRLDIPFSASVHARSAIVPRRDAHGAVRYGSSGNLPFSGPVLRRQAALLREAEGAPSRSRMAAVHADIHHFVGKERSLFPGRPPAADRPVPPPHPTAPASPDDGPAPAPPTTTCGASGAVMQAVCSGVNGMPRSSLSCSGSVRGAVTSKRLTRTTDSAARFPRWLTSRGPWLPRGLGLRRRARFGSPQAGPLRFSLERSTVSSAGGTTTSTGLS
ncbi:methylaspartate mutase [Streptomyces sp. NPDC058667]|uniref:methylaspartate mutase n=1 Tax=Streptomyces sp. NPDC058667 TaxID=3346588 RepID=UPI00365F1E23